MKLLLFENDPILSEIIEVFLVERGLHVRPFFDIKEAMDALLSETYDVALLDINMPFSRESACMEALNSASIKIPVIFLSSLGLSDEAKKSLTFNAEEYLVRPFDLEELLKRIEHIHKLHLVGQSSCVVSGTCHVYDSENLCIIGPEAVYYLPDEEAQLLVYLLANQGRIVSFEEIIDAICCLEGPFAYASLRSRIENLQSYGLGNTLEMIEGTGCRLRL